MNTPLRHNNSAGRHEKLAYIVDLDKDVDDGLIYGVGNATVQPQPETWSQTYRGVTTTYNVRITGLYTEVFTPLPSETVEISFNFWLTVITTQTRGTKLISTDSYSEPYDRVKIFK